MEYKKDSKGRVLRDGESQRKDGSYQFRYTGLDGERHYVYSWRLIELDPIPPRKKKQAPLRTLEKRILRDLDDGIDPSNKYTFGDIYQKFIEMKFEIRDTTKQCYEGLYDRYIKERFENIAIGRINYSDIKRFYISLLEVKKLSGGTIKKVDALMKQVFDVAVLDNYLRKNPCTGVIKEIRKSKLFKTKKKVKALTKEQQSKLIEFVKSSEKYKCWFPLISFLLGTGCRIGEAVGLYWKNVDFENNMIHIDHSLTTVDGKHQITEPKTESSIRDIPMLKDIKKVLCSLKFGRQDCSPDDYVFVNRHGHFIDRNYFNASLKRIAKACNAKMGKEVIPEDISPHVFRHTFCTRMCENESKVKVIQAVMGHSDISTTMDIYTDVFNDQKCEAFKNLEGKIKVV